MLQLYICSFFDFAWICARQYFIKMKPPTNLLPVQLHWSCYLSEILFQNFLISATKTTRQENPYSGRSIFRWIQVDLWNTFIFVQHNDKHNTILSLMSAWVSKRKNTCSMLEIKRLDYDADLLKVKNRETRKKSLTYSMLI